MNKHVILDKNQSKRHSKHHRIQFFVLEDFLFPTTIIEKVLCKETHMVQILIGRRHILGVYDKNIRTHFGKQNHLWTVDAMFAHARCVYIDKPRNSHTTHIHNNLFCPVQLLKLDNN